MGANEWREYPSWPVPGARSQSYFLHAGGLLSRDVPSAGSLSKFDYDPARPTPSLYGPTIEGKSGSGDMGPLERRADVLVFTSEPLDSNVDVIGAVSAEVYLRSNTQYTDLYLCLCDVDTGGLSTNVCDGYRGCVRRLHLRWTTGARAGSLSSSGLRLIDSGGGTGYA